MNRFIISILCFALLSACGNSYHYSGGKAARVYNDGEIKVVYTHPTLGFLSTLVFGVESIDTDGKSLAQARLPRAYRKCLLGASPQGFQKKVLYSAIENRLSHYFVATITEEPLSDSLISRNKVDLSELASVSNYDFKSLRLGDGQTLLFYHYGVFKSKKMAFDILSFHTLWRSNQMISISIIRSGSRAVPGEIASPRQIANLFQRISIEE